MIGREGLSSGKVSLSPLFMSAIVRGQYSLSSRKKVVNHLQHFVSMIGNKTIRNDESKERIR